MKAAHRQEMAGSETYNNNQITKQEEGVSSPRDLV